MDDAFDDQEFVANITYRIAYGEAARIVEVRGRNFAHGRDRVNEVRIEAQALARDIAGRMGVEPAAIVEAVEDALAGRRPRW